ncbi:MFS transporter [Streptomyces roseus]|uniref:MFS transporter n=1 Tax=Streptomyces roseus TaxID=66430 RepID=UPI003684A1F1
MTSSRRNDPVGRRILLVALATGSLFGYSIAAVNPALKPLAVHFYMTGAVRGLLVSSLLLGALLGSFAAGRLAERYGYRSLLVWSGLTAAAASVAGALAVTLGMVILSRLVLGLALGITTTLAPLLITAQAPPHRRGALVGWYQLALTAAMLVALTVGWARATAGDWRLLLAVNGVPGLLQALALSALAPPQLMPASRSVYAVSMWRHLRDRSTRRPVVIACGAALMNACVGVGAVTYYSTFVFGIAGFAERSSADTASLAVGAVNLAATAGGLWLIRRFGRRPLLSIGLGGIAVSLAVSAWSMWAQFPGWVTVAGVLVFMACYAFSVGPIAWLLIAEVLPKQIKDRTAANAVGMNWAATLLITLIFPMVVGTPGDPSLVAAAFAFFFVVTLVFLVFTRLFVPETLNRSLDSVQAELTGRDHGPRACTDAMLSNS